MSTVSRIGLLVAAALLSTGCSPREPVAEGRETPVAIEPGALAGQNLLLVTIDTLRPDRLGAYGHAGAETPHLDRLAKEGVRFEHCYSPVPLTLPAHASLMTGRLPPRHGVRNNGVHELAADEETLAERFAARGYDTAAIVSAYVLLARFGLDQGFEHYDDALGGELLRGFASEIPADEVYAKFQTWFREREAGAPFFTWVHFYDPHLPYEPPGELAERFAAAPYDGEVAHVDRQVGKMLDDLREAGLLENTSIIVTSDHGEAFGEHGEFGHSIFGYEQNLRVPLILYAPGRLAPEVVGERVRLIDLAPTLGELFGLDLPSGAEGQSLVDLLSGNEREGLAEVYFESFAGQLEKNWAPVQGLIEGHHKYISLPEPELYDLETDPAEETNLIARERRLARELDRALQAQLLDAAGAEASRELSEEDVRQLSALGYLSPAARRASRELDPKKGIVIDRGLAEVEELLVGGELEAAGERFEALLADHPEAEMPIVHQVRYRLAKARGEEERALRALSEGVRKFPEFEQLGLDLAGYLLELERFDDAARAASELLERNPRFSQALIVRAAAREKSGDLAGALADYREARELEPRNTALALRLVGLHMQRGEAAEAAALYGELAESGALESQPDHYFRAAVLEAQLGRSARAEELFRRGLELAPRGIHHLTFALLLDRNGKRAEAIQEMEIALAEYGAELAPQQKQLGETMLARWRQEAEMAK